VLLVTLGLCTGLIAHTAAVALGIAAVFQASPIAFDILKYLGAGYLIYLAWQAFNAKPTALTSGADSGLSIRTLYSRGIIMNITNPKFSIFFLAFLPQFTLPAAGNLALQFVHLERFLLWLDLLYSVKLL
jgi:threonine/homoserine/homoserine lactone efflux protein